MAKENITIKRYNGTNYDILYPETSIGQVKNLQNTLNNKAVIVSSESQPIEPVLGDFWFEEKPLPLTFTANTPGSTVKLCVYGTPTLGQNFSYSTDGYNWIDVIPGTTVITLANAGDNVSFKGDNPNGVSQSERIRYWFDLAGSIAASGNIMSLIDNGACTCTTIPNNYCFCGLFTNAEDPPYMGTENPTLTSTPELPATTLTRGCYHSMFLGCESIKYPPVLPATVMMPYCYMYMFQSCTSLIIAPELPSTQISEGCYGSMFTACIGLKEAPELPATTLAWGCYRSMFMSCTSFTAPPALPATTLAGNCYAYMFNWCKNLKTPPALPATTLANYCYYHMFGTCNSLQVNDSPVSGVAEQAWTIPSSGTFTNTYLQENMFGGGGDDSCPGTRASDNMAGAAGQSYTYYTQNTPIG